MIEGMPACLGGGIVDGYTMDEANKAGVNVIEELKHQYPLGRPGCSRGSRVEARKRMRGEKRAK